MKTILVINQKGGVGKTVLADEITFAFERDNIECNFYDLDGQGSSIHETCDSTSAQVAIVDTPGALQEDMAKWAAEADFIIVPTLMTASEMKPLIRMIEILKPYMDQKPVVFVLNKWTRYNSTRDFIEWFESEYPELKYFIVGDYECFHVAGAEGKSVFDLKYSKATKKATQQIGAIYAAIKYELGIKESWRK